MIEVGKTTSLAGDLAAGLSVAAVALPVGIAYADIVGVAAEMGVYAGIFPVFAYALLGSSRQLVIGPDTATCLLLAASVTPLAGGDPARHVALVSAVTLLSGALFLMAGAARLGFFASFLSRPILTGFMNGVAIVVAAGQLPKIFGYASEAEEALPRLAEFARRVSESHPATALVGLGAVAGLFGLKRLAPRLPGALIVVAGAVAAAAWLDLGAQGVALTGAVPAGLPAAGLPALEPETWRSLLPDAAGVTLIAFTSGMLTAQSYARRGGYAVDANRELFAMGAANLVAGATQGFAVAGTDSRTAVAAASGARTRLAAVFAALTMLAAAFLLSDLIAQAPAAAFGAVVLVAVLGLFDIAGLRAFWAMSPREAAISVATTLGVLTLGVLPGVLLAVILSLAWLLAMALNPSDAVLGRAPGVAGFHNVADFTEAETTPGLLLYRFESNIVFFNADAFCAQLEAAIAAQPAPVEWVVLDLGPVSLIDATALMRFDDLRESLAKRGVTLAVARARRNLARAFRGDWARARLAARPTPVFDTLKTATAAFHARNRAAPAEGA
ncbi:MAG: SulP family inorganic anion transporter [Rubrimonas sp.]|uniref:SulP family inorganic anion transporter n=1 Tax=Rubrimonas sp. TaxID=2036015 RepID=UPI002FDECFB2